MRVLVCGSRAWEDGALIEKILSSLDSVELVVEGEARGADTWARLACETLEIPILAFPADWERYGRGAGPKRNQQMLDEGEPELVLAFSEDLNSSRGTADMVARARRAGLRTILVNRQGRREL